MRFCAHLFNLSRTVHQELSQATSWGRKAIFQAMGSNIHETLIFSSEPLE